MKEYTTSVREDWLKQRRITGIGASEAPIILGLSHFKSPFQLYHEKLGLEVESDAEVESREWGLALEDPIAARFEKETKRMVYKPPVYTIYQNDEHPFMIATLDRWQHAECDGVVVPSPLELKTAHWNIRSRWEEEPPIEYIVQVQHQMAVTGAPMASIAALIGGMEFLWCDVKRDDELIAQLIRLESEFWMQCIAQTPPPVDGSDETRATLKALYKKETGLVVPLPIEVLEWDSEMVAAKAIIDEQQKRLDLNKNRIINAIGSATAGQCSNGLMFTYKSQTRPATVSKESTFRVLRKKGAPK